MDESLRATASSTPQPRAVILPYRNTITRDPHPEAGQRDRSDKSIEGKLLVPTTNIRESPSQRHAPHSQLLHHHSLPSGLPWLDMWDIGSSQRIELMPSGEGLACRQHGTAWSSHEQHGRTVDSDARPLVDV